MALQISVAKVSYISLRGSYSHMIFFTFVIKRLQRTVTKISDIILVQNTLHFNNNNNNNSNNNVFLRWLGQPVIELPFQEQLQEDYISLLEHKHS